MKKTLLILLTLFLSLSNKAQEPRKPSKEERVNNLSRTLSVDKQKAEEIAAALDYNVEQIRATARDTSLKPQARQELMRKLHEERQAKITATLTSEQLAAMQAKIAPQLQAQRDKMELRRKEQLKKLEERGIKQEEKKADKKP